MADEGFHEIQLDGKQLVFLFMAATVVSVVVFLLGVMVGRNVRLPAPEVAAVSEDPSADPTADARSASTTGTTERIPLSAQETLTYAERLEAPDPAEERLGPSRVADPAPDPVRVAPQAAPSKAPAARERARARARPPLAPRCRQSRTRASASLPGTVTSSRCWPQ